MANFQYIYCPVCTTKLQERHTHGALRMACTACDFVLFRDPKVSVIGVVTVKDRILMTRRAVDPQKGKWSLPGGYMDAGEMPRNALERELMEEVGLEIEVGDLIDIFPLTVEAPAQPIGTINDLSEKKVPIEDTISHGKGGTASISTASNDIVPMGIVSIGIVLAFNAWPVSGQAEPLESNDDVSDAAWQSWSEISRDNLAFESTDVLLQQWHLKRTDI